eukprot:1137986-Prymnesium_polylepis.1
MLVMNVLSIIKAHLLPADDPIPSGHVQVIDLNMDHGGRGSMQAKDVTVGELHQSTRDTKKLVKKMRSVGSGGSVGCSPDASK